MRRLKKTFTPYQMKCTTLRLCVVLLPNCTPGLFSGVVGCEEVRQNYSHVAEQHPHAHRGPFTIWVLLLQLIRDVSRWQSHYRFVTIWFVLLCLAHLHYNSKLGFHKKRACDWPANAEEVLFGRKRWLSEFKFSKAAISWKHFELWKFPTI